MRNMLLSCTAAAALLGTMAVASAQEVDIKSVGLMPGYGGEWASVSSSSPTVNWPGSYEAAGVILLTTTSNSILPVFCVDLFHNITLGDYSGSPLKYQFTPLVNNSNTRSGDPVGGGQALTDSQKGEIQALVNMGAAEYLAGGSPAATDFSAIQAAIWQIEYGGTVTLSNTSYTDEPTLDALVQTDVQWAMDNPAPPNTAMALYPIGAGGAGFGTYQGFGTNIPEPSTWAMMVMGFAGLGYAAFRKAGRASISALA